MSLFRPPLRRDQCSQCSLCQFFLSFHRALCLYHALSQRPKQRGLYRLYFKNVMAVIKCTIEVNARHRPAPLLF